MADALPVALLLAVAGAQMTLARTAGLSPWKGGGFGMFSTTDDAGRRRVRVFVSAPDVRRKSPSRRRSRMRRHVPRCCRTTPALAAGAWCGRTRAPVSAARWTRSASRHGESSTRPTHWRRPLASRAISSTVWTRLLHPARDEVGVPDSVLKLTAIILLLRPFDIWWVAPFVLVAACLSLVAASRQAGADHLAACGGARGGPDRPRLAAVGQPHLSPRLLVSGDWAGALGPAPAATLATSSRWLLGAAFAMAVLWKALLSPDYVGRPLFQGDAPDRRAVCRCVAGVWRPDARIRWLRTASSWSRCRKEPSFSIRRRSSSRRVCGSFAAVATWGGLALEALIALLCLMPGRQDDRAARHAALLAFCATTYALAPVAGFGWLIATMGLAQCRPSNGRCAAPTSSCFS